MAVLDLKDRKILYQLDLNCRQSNAQIGKKVGLSKQVVDYRIKRMQEEEVIKYFWTQIDTYKLGYNCSRLYLSLQYANPMVRREIIEHLCGYKNLWAVMSTTGLFDIDFVFWVKDFNDFSFFWNKTNDKYGDYFAECLFSVVTKVDSYRLSYILLDEYDRSDRDDYVRIGGGKTVNIDKVDYKLLNEMVLNARTPLINLAEKLDCSSQSVNYRIKNLMKTGIITRFRVGINISYFGLQDFGLSLFLKDPRQKRHIIDYFKNNPYATYTIYSIGFSDLQFEVHMESSEKIIQIVDEINSKFSNSIKKYIYITVIKTHKEQWLPEMNEEDFKAK